MQEEVITDAVDEGLVGVMPTFIKETFPDAGATDTLDDLSSTEVDVPGYGGGGGSLSIREKI